MARTRGTLAICFVVGLLPMLASQIVRIGLVDPVAWLLCDYGGRLGTVAALAAIPIVLSALLMQLYRRSNVLWPAIAIHYTVDVIAFA